MAKVTDKIRDLIDPKHKGFRHTILFRILIALALLIVLGIIYNVFIRPSSDSNTSDDDSDAEAACEAELDTIDVVGDYLWPGLKDQNKQKEDSDKTDEEETKPVEHAVSAPQADAATEEDIEDATGPTPQITEDPTLPSTKDNKQDAQKVETMDKPTVEKIE